MNKVMENARTKVLVADGQAPFRKRICALLRSCEDIEVIGEATNQEEVIQRVRKEAPDVVFMDVVLPATDLDDIICGLNREHRDLKVLLVSQYKDRDTIVKGLRAGSRGYLPKDAAPGDVIAAVHALHRGDYFIHPSFTRIMIDDFLETEKQAKSESYHRLTARERQILCLIAEGYKSREIAAILNVSTRTVQGHRAKTMSKLQIHSLTELTKYAIRKHLVEL